MMVVVVMMFLAAAASAGTMPDAVPENKYVKVHVSIAPDSIRSGHAGELLVHFSPVDGIHVNADPPVEFRFDSTQVLTLRDETTFTTDKETGYLASTVRQVFVVARGAKPGGYILKGKLIYYYCSDDEGWCTKFTHPVELPLMVLP